MVAAGACNSGEPSRGKKMNSEVLNVEELEQITFELKLGLPMKLSYGQRKSDREGTGDGVAYKTGLELQSIFELKAVKRGKSRLRLQ